MVIKVSEHVGTRRRDMSQQHACSSDKITKSKCVHTQVTVLGTCPRDMSQRNISPWLLIIYGTCNTNSCNILSLRVEFRLTCVRDKTASKFVLHVPKIISTHEGTFRCDMSLEHVPTKIFIVCTHLRRDMSPPTSPYCEHMILSLLRVAATCPCDMLTSPRVRRP